MRALTLTLLALFLAAPTFAAESQKRIPGVISLDEKPVTFRSGKPGDWVRYIAITCNLGKLGRTWPVKVSVDPVALGKAEAAPRTSDSRRGTVRGSHCACALLTGQATLRDGLGSRSARSACTGM